MKKFLILIGLILANFSIFAQNKTQFTINGTCDGLKNGDTVFLGYVSSRGIITLDTAVISNDKFTFTSEIEATTLRTLIAVEKGMPVAATDFIAEVGTNIGVKLIKQSNVGQVTGSSATNLWRQLTDHDDREAAKMEPFWGIIGDSTKTLGIRLAAKSSIDSISKGISKYHAQFILDNIPSGLSGFLFGLYYTDLPKDQVTAIMDAMSKKMPEDPYYQRVLEMHQAEAATAVGATFRDISLVDINGNMQKLSDVVKSNKLVLLDFWASWCKPCLMEMPNVKKVYQEFHAKGFEIYAVSLDENQIAWQNIVRNYGMNWIHVSDLKGWQSAGGKIYNISSIPATFLIDNSGKIIAKNLRGAELHKKVSSILN